VCGDHGLVFEALLERDDVAVSRSPWGADDEIGRLNWVTPELSAEIVGRLDGRHVIDLSVEYFKGMPSWIAAGDPLYDIWMTHTPDGAIIDGLAGAEPRLLEKYSYAGDAITMYVHCGTHLDTLNHFGHHGVFWNGWTAKQHLGSRHWLKGGPEHHPPIIARAVLLDVAGLHGVDCLPPCYEITRADLVAAAERLGVEPRRHDVVCVRTGRMTVWPDVQGYITDQPGIGLEAARHLCEEVGAMCVAGDSLSLEVVPNPDPEKFLPVHSYMFSTAGAQIIEVVDLEALAAERIGEFAFLGFPLKLRGATGAPLRPVAVPLRS